MLNIKSSKINRRRYERHDWSMDTINIHKADETYMLCWQCYLSYMCTFIIIIIIIIYYHYYFKCSIQNKFLTNLPRGADKIDGSCYFNSTTPDKQLCLSFIKVSFFSKLTFNHTTIFSFYLKRANHT